MKVYGNNRKFLNLLVVDLSLLKRFKGNTIQNLNLDLLLNPTKEIDFNDFFLDLAEYLSLIKINVMFSNFYNRLSEDEIEVNRNGALDDISTQKIKKVVKEVFKELEEGETTGILSFFKESLDKLYVKESLGTTLVCLAMNEDEESESLANNCRLMKSSTLTEALLEVLYYGVGYQDIHYEGNTVLSIENEIGNISVSQLYDNALTQ